MKVELSTHGTEHVLFKQKDLLLAGVFFKFQVNSEREALGFNRFDGLDERLVQLDDLSEYHC
jgi:hypothetical protein